jgi:hypothetical protein
MARPPRKRPGRKLLIASIGVAAVSYACQKTESGGGAKDGDGVEQVGNLMPPQEEPLPPEAADAATTPDTPPEPVGNLMPPPEDPPPAPEKAQ